MANVRDICFRVRVNSRNSWIPSGGTKLPRINPYEIAWRFQSTQYEISVSNPEHQCRGVLKATLDDVMTNGAAIPLVDDGRTHDVRILLGTAS